MRYADPNPVSSFANLRSRIERLLYGELPASANSFQLSFDIEPPGGEHQFPELPDRHITAFLDFLAALAPGGDLYLFGGVLRDIALFGQRGFHSDIDLVVDGDWEPYISFLEAKGASRNRFGGYRLLVDGWPIDIWSAERTWAISEGYVAWCGISSLLETTVLNWDAILMNWRTRRFLCSNDYLGLLRDRILDVVLEHNPNALGMAVRVFRHLSLKDARLISPRAAQYMARCTREYSYHQLVDSELNSYGDQFIEAGIYQLFRELEIHQPVICRGEWEAAKESLLRQGVTITQKQGQFSLVAEV